MDTMTEIAFEEARRQLFDPAVEEEDIRLAEQSIRRMEKLRENARTNTQDVESLKMLEKTLSEQIKSRKKWICTLKEFQGLKAKRQDGFRKIAQ